MKQDINKYEFRAMTIQKTVIAMILWIVIFFSIFFSMDKLFFYNEKGTDVFTTLKTTGIPLIISFGVLMVISHTIVSSKYTIQFFEEKIVICKKNNKKYNFLLEDIEYIQLGISHKPVTSGIIIKTLKNKLILYNGLFFTFSKEKYILENMIIKKINPFFENLETFKLEIKKDKNSIAYIYTKK